MIEYLKKLFTKWFFYLGFLPTIYDYASAYFDWGLKLPSLFLYLVGFLAFLFASYTIWADERKEKSEVQRLLANPVDYNIIGELTPIDFEVEKQLNRIDNNAFKAQEEIDSANQEINQLFGDDKSMQRVISAITASSNLFDSYKYELLKYIDELSNYIEKSEEYKNQYRERVNVLSSRYFIIFNIENIGNKSDSQINIEIKTQKNNFIDATNMYDLVFKNIPTLPQKPESPIQKFAKNIDFMKQINSQPHPDLFRLNRSKVQFDNKSALITIKEMNVGQIEDTLKEIMFIELLDETDFQIIIHSKESSAIIEKSLEVKFNNTAKKLSKYP